MYLIAHTAKDCSVMISFQRGGETKEVYDDRIVHGIIQNGSEKYFYKVGIVDLDPKLPSKIPYYYKQDTKIVENYQMNQSLI